MPESPGEEVKWHGPVWGVLTRAACAAAAAAAEGWSWQHCRDGGEASLHRSVGIEQERQHVMGLDWSHGGCGCWQSPVVPVEV